jgi:hypothetical protein
LENLYGGAPSRMIPKSGNRFSEKIMRQQNLEREEEA